MPSTASRRVLVWLAAIFALALLGEAVLRTYGFGRAIRYRPDARLGWVLEPGQHAFNVRGRAPVHTNRLGFRGPEVAIPKPPSVVRLLFLGDGTVLNNQTPFAEIFPERVRRGLAERSRQPVEAVIAAVPGYQTEQYALLTRDPGARLAADAIVVGFCWNDWAPTTMRGPDLGPQAYGEQAGAGGPWRALAWRDFVIRGRTAWQRRRSFQRLATEGRGLPAAAQDEEVARHVTARLDSIAAAAGAVHAELVFVLLPARITAHDADGYAARTARLRAWAAAHGAAWVDPAPLFDAARARGVEPFLDDIHLGRPAQALVAEAILAAWRPRALAL